MTSNVNEVKKFIKLCKKIDINTMHNSIDLLKSGKNINEITMETGILSNELDNIMNVLSMPYKFDAMNDHEKINHLYEQIGGAGFFDSVSSAAKKAAAMAEKNIPSAVRNSQQFQNAKNAIKNKGEELFEKQKNKLQSINNKPEIKQQKIKKYLIIGA